MKKILSLVMVMCMILATPSIAFAADTDVIDGSATNDAVFSAMSSEELAYCNISEVPANWRDAVLAARNEIIYNEEWVADGYAGYIEDVETGEIIRTLTSFSELFPGWDLPVHDVVNEDAYTTFPLSFAKASSLNIQSADSWLRLGSISHYLAAASNVNATPFITFLVDPYTMGTSIRSYATSLTSSQTCNIGFSNASTGEDLGNALYLSLYQTAVISDVGNINLSIRASTYSTPGWSTLAIDGAYRVIDLK